MYKKYLIRDTRLCHRYDEAGDRAQKCKYYRKQLKRV